MATVSITVTPVNDQPVLAPIGDKTVNEGQLLQFIVSATDVENNPLSFSAMGLPPGATFAPNTRTFSYTPGFEVSTAQSNRGFDVAFLVSDVQGGADSETVRITVIDVTPKAQLQSVIGALQAIETANPGTPLADKVEDARAKAQTAFNDLQKTPPDQQAAVGNLEGIVGISPTGSF